MFFRAVLFTIQIGSNTLTTPDPERVTLSSSEYVVHPNFDPNKIENDIALIKLRMPITYNCKCNIIISVFLTVYYFSQYPANQFTSSQPFKQFSSYNSWLGSN